MVKANKQFGDGFCLGSAMANLGGLEIRANSFRLAMTANIGLTLSSESMVEEANKYYSTAQEILSEYPDTSSDQGSLLKLAKKSYDSICDDLKFKPMEESE